MEIIVWQFIKIILFSAVIGGCILTKNTRLIVSIFGIGLLSFLGIVIETALNIAFPSLMQEFNISAVTVQWLTSGYMIVSTLIIPFGSFLRKRFRALILFRVAAATFLIGTLCAATSNNFSILLCGRLLQGVADGICLPLMFSLILEQAPATKMGTFMGLGNLVIAFAPAVGPVYGGLILKNFTWNYLFWLIVPIIAVAWILGEISISQEQALQRVPFDYQGGALLVVLLVSSLLLIINLSSGANINEALILLVLVVISCVLFVKVERGNSSGVVDITLFKNKQFVLFLLTFFLLQLISLSMSYLMPNTLQLALKQTSDITGLLILPAAVIDALMSILAGQIYDKISHKLPIILGLGIIIVALLGAAINQLSVLSVVATYIIFMIGLGLSYGNIMTLSLSQLTESEKNDGNALYMTAQPFSGAIGTAMAASVMGLMQTQNSNLIIGTTAGYKSVQVILVMLAVSGLIFCLINLIGRKDS